MKKVLLVLSVLSVLVGGKNIFEVTNLSVRDLYSFMKGLKLTKEQEEISIILIKS